VIIVNDKLARRFFPGGNAVGQRMKIFDERALEIVGVVADVRQYGLAEDAPLQMYQPLFQHPVGWIFLLVRTSGDPASAVAGIRARVAAIDGELALAGVRPMAEVVAESVGARRFAVWLLGVFAAVSLALAVIGIYGVIADAVVQRTREIGVRVALGATPRDVLASMMGIGVVPALLGIALGLAGAAGLVRLLGGLLYGVSQTDPLTWIAAPLLIAFVAAVASYIPARRATRVDPMTALRFE
jgi:hypothetical protein